jgi:hypothetical protein
MILVTPAGISAGAENEKSLASIRSSPPLAEAEGDASSLGGALALSLADALGSALAEALGLVVAAGWPERGRRSRIAISAMAATIRTATMVPVDERGWTVMTYLRDHHAGTGRHDVGLSPA